MSKPTPIPVEGERARLASAAGIVAVALLGALPLSAAEQTFRYYRFQPTKLSNSGGAMQISEFTFSHGGSEVSRAGMAVTSGNLDPAAGEGPLKLIDADVNTKLFRGSALAAGNEVVFDFGAATTIDGYNFATANDSVAYSDRTPVSWVFSGSNDKSTWVAIDQRIDYPVVNANLTFYGGFSLPAITPATIDQFAIRNTAAEGTSAILLNGSVATIDFNTSGADSLEIQQGGSVFPLTGASGTFTPSPPVNATTTYTLVAKKAGADDTTRPAIVRTVAGGPASYRYVRYTVTSRRTGGAGMIQQSEFQFFNGSAADPANRVPVVSAENPGGSNGAADGEGVMKLYDGDINSKWLDGNMRPVIFDFGETPVTFDRYQFYTGNDASDRDPRTWKLEGSNDQVRWNLIENVDFAYPAPDGRNFASREIPLPGVSLAPQIDQFAVSPGTLTRGGDLTFTYDVQAADLAAGDTIVLTSSSGATLPAITTAYGTLVLTGASSPALSAEYTLTVTKTTGATLSRTVPVTVIDDPGEITLQFDDFSSAAASFQLVGSASITAPDNALPNRLRLTPEIDSQHGSAWILKKQDFTGGFEATFGMSMNQENPDGNAPADGISFVIHNSPSGNTEVGTGETGVSLNSLSVCFRSFGFASDPASRVEVRSGTTVLATGIADTTPGMELHGVPGHPYSLGSLATDPPYRVRIVYMPGNLDVYIDGIAIIQNVDVDLEDIGATDAAGHSFVGFTARTGGNVQNNDITSWHLNHGDFSALPPFGIVKTRLKSSTRTGPPDTLDIVWNARVENDYELLNSLNLEDALDSWYLIDGLRYGVDGQMGVSIDFRTRWPDEPKGFFSVHEITY